ncbi:MAG: hypothetical protein JO053_10635 [Acidobacteria bacterium]|nr:hypothetical protein [Acidobacteriota bacterium]
MKESNPDVSSLDAIIVALYEVISGDAGKARDWDRFRHLFCDGARLIPISADGLNRREALAVLSPEAYIKRVEPIFATDGFYESEIARTTESFGSIAHVFSTYEARRSPAHKDAFLRGINSIQLLFDGNRWWIVTVYWQPETSDGPIPEKYL